jgi:hypothetical protein
LHLVIRLLCFALGFFLATTGPALLTRPEGGVSLYIYDMEPTYVMVLNGYYAYLGISLTAIGMVLVVTAFYRKEERYSAVVT